MHALSARAGRVGLVVASFVGLCLVGRSWQSVSLAHAAPALDAAFAVDAAVEPEDESERRVGRRLLALWDFDRAQGEGSGKENLVLDRSGHEPGLDLVIETPRAVRWKPGALEVISKARIRSKRPAKRLIDTIRRKGELTIEAWVRPARLDQKGPARIVTLSKNSTERNWTLGQEGDHFDVRLRTTKTGKNGVPSLPSKGKSLKTELTHVVYTRDRRGRAKLYLNGDRNESRQVDGKLNFDSSMRVSLADEIGGQRPWLGTYRLVAIYGSSLSAKEVAQNYRAGPDAAHEGLAVRVSVDPRALEFETRVAPILARRCLECHDPATRKGKLDLSRRELALAGGKNGPPIVPGKPLESLLWEQIESEDMPKKQEPLSAEEKKIVREWIEAGAVWSIDRIDPAVYVHGGEAEAEFVRRLTRSEYIETVRATTGVDISKEAEELLPADLRADGFSNTAYNLGVDLEHIGAYARLAETVVERMDLGAFAARFSKSRRFTDDDMGRLIERMGKFVLRGPLEKHEVVAYRGISTSVAGAGADYEEAVGYILEALLQSPRFIYRVERQVGDGGELPVDEYELACRMSYTVWGGPPDAKLLRAADDGLLDEEGVRGQLDRMLEDPRAVENSLRFAAEWLNLGRLDNLRPNPQRYPDWKPELASDMRAETLAFFREVVWKERRPLADLLDAQVTFLTPRLAAHYGIEAGPAAEASSELRRYDVRKIPSRGGLLTQGSLLTVGGDEASMVTRGLLVLHEFLRGVVNDPPPFVDTTPVPSAPGRTQRAVALERIEDRTCGGCHGRFEPLAFGLERFDGLGSYHELDEHGNELREDGEVLIPGQPEALRYKSSAELMELLADSERVRETITWKLTQFAIGRPLGARDVRAVRAIHREAYGRGEEGTAGTYQELIRAIVLSDLVQMTRTEKDAEE